MKTMDMDLSNSLVILSLFVLIEKTSASAPVFMNSTNTASTSYFSTRLDLMLEHDSFTTVLISSLRDCRSLCDAVTGCEVVNYRHRGHVCRLIHYVGMTDVNVTETRVAGYVSWRKAASYAKVGVSELCPNCMKTQSCKVVPETGECKPFACVNPNQHDGTTIFLGNINTVGGKVLRDSRSMYCSDKGTWIEMFSGFQDYRVGNMTFKLKIVEEKVSKRIALESCLNHGAKLTTLLTKEKLEFFRGIEDKLPGSFWIDLEKKRDEGTLWITSDGQEVVLDTTLLEGKRIDHDTVMCALSTETKDWRINTVRCYHRRYFYICEMPSK